MSTGVGFVSVMKSPLGSTFEGAESAGESSSLSLSASELESSSLLVSSDASVFLDFLTVVGLVLASGAVWPFIGGAGGGAE